ncbi:MAG: hypothetical protein LBN08_00485 [Lactobacillales bacterium]|jgi:hypothetical protein|nr:hypothetical protein [Lactobacillales bacterium]
MYEEITATNIIYDVDSKSRKLLIYSGVSACLLLGIPVIDKFDYNKPRVIGKSRRSSSPVKCFSSALFNERYVTCAKFGYRCADYLKIIFDLGKEASAVGLICAIGHCLFKGYFSLEEFRLFVKNNSSEQYMGNLRKVLPFVSDGDESPFETLVRLAIYLLGYENPIQQLPFYKNGRFIGRIDFFWETRKGRMAFEVDGALKGRKPGYYEEERLRQAELELQGYTVYRLMYKQYLRNELPDLLEKMGVRKANNKPRKLPINNGLKNPSRFQTDF